MSTHPSDVITMWPEASSSSYHHGGLYPQLRAHISLFSLQWLLSRNFITAREIRLTHNLPIHPGYLSTMHFSIVHHLQLSVAYLFSHPSSWCVPLLPAPPPPFLYPPILVGILECLLPQNFSQPTMPLRNWLHFPKQNTFGWYPLLSNLWKNYSADERHLEK